MKRDDEGRWKLILFSSFFQRRKNRVIDKASGGVATSSWWKILEKIERKVEGWEKRRRIWGEQAGKAIVNKIKSIEWRSLWKLPGKRHYCHLEHHVFSLCNTFPLALIHRPLVLIAWWKNSTPTVSWWSSQHSGGCCRQYRFRSRRLHHTRSQRYHHYFKNVRPLFYY